MAYAAISKPGLHFNGKLYSGNGSTQNITGVGFQPDFIWQKERTSTSYHVITDAVRGNTKQLFTNVSAAEATDSNYITSFDSDGFGQGQNDDTNQSGQTYVAWNWKAAGTSGSANSDGSIATTVAANTTAGFSIVKWTGTGSAGTLGHGLGAVPHAIWVKKASQSDDWFCWHTALGAQGKMNFNNTSAVQNDTGYWNNTTPTNQVFSVTSNGANNASGQTFIAYCFTSIKGYSKFGVYQGLSSNSGNFKYPFIYLGFKPAFVMVKAYDAVKSWYIWDNKRDTGNVTGNALIADGGDAEFTGSNIDILSNGFKIRDTGSGTNSHGNNYTYYAFASEPLVANVGQSIPTTAR